MMFCSFLCLCSFSGGVEQAQKQQHELYVCANATTNHCDVKCKSLLGLYKKQYSHGWAVRHDSIGHTMKTLECKVIIEIGIARGELTHYLLHRLHNQIQEYHAVDPFLGGYDANDAMSSELSEANAPVAWSEAILTMFKEKGCIFRLHFGKSEERCDDFVDETIDCIFIDGDHTYEGIKQDIIMYEKKLKKGGYFLFDDYSSSYMGVVKAIDELVDVNRIDFHKINSHNNYYVQKPKDRPLLTTYTYPADENIPLPPIPSF